MGSLLRSRLVRQEGYSISGVLIYMKKSCKQRCEAVLFWSAPAPGVKVAFRIFFSMHLICIDLANAEIEIC